MERDERRSPVKIRGVVSRAIVGTGIAVLLVSTTSLSVSAGTEAANVRSPAIVADRQLPSYVLPSRSAAPAAIASHAVDTEAVTDTPGNVYDAEPPPTQVPSPESDPAD